jgi:hypothetical protein
VSPRHKAVTGYQIKLLQVMSDYTKPQLPKGGRGLKAPYETKTIRVPVPCLDAINKLVTSYHETGKTEIEDSTLSYTDAVLEAEKILNSNIGKTKSAKKSLEKLLQVIYKLDLILPIG